MKLRKGQKFTVANPVDCKCLCGARVTLSEGDAKTEPCVMHAMPTCKDFDKRGPIEYVRWLREGGAS